MLSPYIYIAVAVAFLSLVGIVKYQHSEIEDLKANQAVWESKNKELSNKIEEQNTLLKQGELKYNKVQGDLNTAKGVNIALSKEFSQLRSKLDSLPLASTCGEAFDELKKVTNDLATRWNKK